jgi:Flp pilus assembly protein TadD
MKYLSKISNYILLISPILLTSFFVYNSKYPAWGNTLFLANALTIALAIYFFRNYRNKKDTNIVDMGLISLAVVVSVLCAFFLGKAPIFNFLGKGVQEWSGVSIILFFLAFAFFLSLKGRLNKIAIWVSAASIIYTVANYLLVKNNISFANYTGYLNIPMLSFAKLINYAFVYSLVTLIASALAYFINKKGIVFTKIKNNILYTTILIVPIALSVVLLVKNTLRYVAANSYYNASQAYSKNDLVNAKNYLNRAISIAPFDEYYLGRIEVTTTEINNMMNGTGTPKDQLANKYKDLVESQIMDAQKAIAYDSSNPRNYMALGLAYERTMLLSKDEGYAEAIKAYEKARALASDKDYVDVVKAKASFGAQKETDALKYIDSALKYNASSSPALFISSQYYAAKDNLKSAIEYGEKTVTTAPTATDARLSLGLLYLKNNNFDQAIQMFGSVLQITNGDNVTALYYLGASYKAKGDTQNLKLVIQELEKRMDPNSKELNDLRGAVAPAAEVKAIKK